MIAKLEMETKTILRKFATLVSTVGRTMEESGVSIQNLKLFFTGCGMNLLAERIHHTDTISEVMNMAEKRKYWTFFDYELLESILVTFCETEEPLLNAYKADFKVYCQRRLFAVPAIVSENASSSSDEVLRFIVLDENFPISTERAKMLQHSMSILLNVHTLYLARMKSLQ